MMYHKVDLVTSGVDAAIRSQNRLEKDTHAVEVGPKPSMIVDGLVSMTNFAKAGLGFTYIYRAPAEQ